MIWTVVLWLGMQGQASNTCGHAPPSLCYYKDRDKMAVEIDGGCPVYTDAPTQFKPLKPVEHVFEVRTKQESVTKVCPFDSRHNWHCKILPKQSIVRHKQAAKM